LIALFSALKEETGEIRKSMTVSGVSALQGCSVIEGKYGGRESLLVLTGMGKEKARRAAEMVLGKYPVSLLISTGFGGGLNEKTAVGDIVVCSRLLNGEAPPRNCEVLESDPRFVSASRKILEKAGPGFLIGTGVTVPFLSSTPENKKELGKQYEADMVEMESYWIAGIAAERKLPFLEVRSISDSVEDDLSFLSRIVSNSGKIRPMSAAANVISHPEMIQTMARFAGKAKKAAKSLAAFFDEFMKEI
jgi:adenosylhomocysteine nucleosidase